MINLDIVLYGGTWLIMFYLAVLFNSWWLKVRNPSEEFRYITLWLWTEWLVYSYVLFARVLHHVDQEWYYEVLSSFTWRIKGFPRLLILSWVAYHFSRKWFRSYREAKISRPG